MTVDSVIIWLDQTYDDVAAVAKAKTGAAIHVALCKVDPYLVTFRDSNKCIDYITDITENETKKVLIISSEKTISLPVNTLLQLSEELLQIASVYILILNDTTEKPLEKTTKVHGVYAHLKALCNQLYQLPYISRKRRERVVHTDFTVTSLPYVANSPSTLPDTITSTTSQTTIPPASDMQSHKRQEAEFMYAQFLRDILIKIESGEQEMVEFCRQKYADDQRQMNAIGEFEEYYDACNAIFWYTRDIFLYRLLNKAHREQDVETLYSLRYFSKDLHLQLKERHATQQATPSLNDAVAAIAVETVYRGQLMDTEEFDKKIRYNKGGFFSVSGFLSTTMHENLAILYAGDRSGGRTDGSVNVQSVLFSINIDKSVNKFPYANISKESAFEEDEGEILFSMGAVFQILSVELDSSAGVWRVNLKLTAEEDDELRKLTEHIKEYIVLADPLRSLAKLMLEMAKYGLAEKYYQLALQDPKIFNNLENVGGVYNNLGLIYDEVGEREKALEHFEKSLRITLKCKAATDLALAPIYNNIASTYFAQGNLEKALFNFNQALDIEMKALVPDNREIALCCNNIGQVYFAQKNYSKAFLWYAKCLEIQLKLLPKNHPHIATTYGNLAALFYARSEYDRAVRYFNKTLEIQVISLPAHHPWLATTYDNLAWALYKDGKLKEALECMNKALEIYLKICPTDHEDPARVQKWIAHVEVEIGTKDAENSS
ncbi:unnamed protein product [Rotaria sp. Silwood1]|nr:unnamed protein product [Rotaria sp. Silwood1]